MSIEIPEFGPESANSRSYREALISSLREHGLIIIRSTTAASYLAFFDSIAERLAHRDSNDSLVTEIAPTHEEGGNGYDGFTRKGLPLHTDGSGAMRPPTVIGMFCATKSSSGGETLVADGLQVVSELEATAPSALLTLASEPVRFGLDVPYVGRILEPSGAGDYWAIRFRDDGLADFGNASRSLDALRKVMEANTVRFSLGPNDAYFLQNGRWTHGRTNFEGERKILRVSGRPFGGLHSIRHGFQWSGPSNLATSGNGILKTA